MFNEFEYIGFKPTDEMEAEGQAVIEEIIDQTPKKLNIIASIQFDGKLYSGSFNGAANRGPSVTAYLADPDFSSLLRRLKLAVFEKLAKYDYKGVYTSESKSALNLY